MIYDCFLFNDELELLELRLMELSPVVDIFVLCESTHTFTGKKKSLHFSENKVRFLSWLPKIRYLAYMGGQHKSPWRNEWGQRDHLARGLGDADSSDVIMLSDVDEIPNPGMIPRKPPPLSVMKQRLYYYYVNCFQAQPWPGTLIGSKGEILPFAERRRSVFFRHTPEGEAKVRPFTGPWISPGGWHFSFLGGVDRIQRKLESYSETETNREEVRDPAHIEHCLATGSDLFFRKGPLVEKQFVSIKSGFPAKLGEWLAKYPQFYREVGVA